MKKLLISLVFALFVTQAQDGFSVQPLPSNMMCCPNVPITQADVQACVWKCKNAGRTPIIRPRAGPLIICNEPAVESCPSHCAMGCLAK